MSTPEDDAARALQRALHALRVMRGNGVIDLNKLEHILEGKA